LKQLRKRLTYANVMSSISVFLILGGATAFAASQLDKNSVGTKQLKKNAVTAAKVKKNAVTSAKIKKNAVTAAKIKDGAVNGSKIADGSVTGVDIAGATTPFSQIVARLRNPAAISFEAEAPTLIGSYVQAAGEDDLFIGGLDVTFAAGCAGPREAVALLLMDPANPSAPTEQEFAALGFARDNTSGAVTKRMEFIEYPIGFLGGLRRMGQAAAQNHSFYVFPVEADCEGGGSGVSGTNIGLDVLGTK
jgi:hypothetical protein